MLLLNTILITILVYNSHQDDTTKSQNGAMNTSTASTTTNKPISPVTTSVFPKLTDLFTMSPFFRDMTLPTIVPDASKSTIFPTLPSNLNPFPVTPFPKLESLNLANLTPVTLPNLPNLFDMKSVALPPMPKMEDVQMNISINPESLMDVPEIVRHWGYPIETYEVLTEDEYILTLHRIPHGRSGSKNKDKPVVFLQHGLLCTSSIWLLNLPHQSPGFIFADKGYDVWLGNMRGNTYSKSHLKMSSRNPNYWRFSWDEMAKYDIPAMINFVLKTTKQKHLYCVGHAQGALTMFAKLSRDQSFAKKLFYNIFGDGEFLSNNLFTKLMTDIICGDKKGSPLCENFIFSASGPDSNQFNSSRIGIYLAHNPAGTSSRNMLHFAQMVKTHRMANFITNQYKIHDYDLSRVKVPLTIFYSNNDWLASAADVEKYLLPSLPESSIKDIV
ncbi:hypothetical protein WR25_03467 [Diploscapter pachys]|uniref:Partial AB-hydrolase lipase domain-containing protein n=1 Tax=Diploscapter pachys TaxID=2018661 RepID=A0A2A2LAY6_9BILA|nr:hypothetical protein WR25_03467 [Diploscapter pachys]